MNLLFPVEYKYNNIIIYVHKNFYSIEFYFRSSFENIIMIYFLKLSFLAPGSQYRSVIAVLQHVVESLEKLRNKLNVLRRKKLRKSHLQMNW